jgi:HSP20 family protein
MLTVELPGVSRGDIHIKVESGVLTLEGHRPPDPDSRRANHLRVERSHGSFSRTFHLPGPVDEGHVTAHFYLGVLEVFVPKAPGAPGGPVRVTVS